MPRDRIVARLLADVQADAAPPKRRKSGFDDDFGPIEDGPESSGKISSLASGR